VEPSASNQDSSEAVQPQNPAVDGGVESSSAPADLLPNVQDYPAPAPPPVAAEIQAGPPLSGEGGEGTMEIPHEFGEVTSFQPKPARGAASDNLLMKDAIRALEEMRLKASGSKEEIAAAKDADLDFEYIRQRDGVYQEVVRDYPTSVGKAVSKKERDETGQHHATLVYGEINFESFGIAFEKIKKRYGLPGTGNSPEKGIMQAPGGIFYDIGSGTGKPTIAAAALHPFEKAYGIEILEGLFNTSLEMKEKWESVAPPMLKDIGQESHTDIEFILGDCTDFVVKDWSDGDVLFANSTCFDDSLMAKIAEKAGALKRGAIFITLTRRLPSTHFEVLEHEMYQMSWGGATVYIQQKTTDPVPVDLPTMTIQKSSSTGDDSG